MRVRTYKLDRSPSFLSFVDRIQEKEDYERERLVESESSEAWAQRPFALSLTTNRLVILFH